MLEWHAVLMKVSASPVESSGAESSRAGGGVGLDLSGDQSLDVDCL
jgi:hypothetical protein